VNKDTRYKFFFRLFFKLEMGHYEEMGHKVFMFVTDIPMYEFHFCTSATDLNSRNHLGVPCLYLLPLFCRMLFFAYTDYNTVGTS